MSYQSRLAIKIANLVAGWSVLLVGVILIPYPGPGWLVVFAGLAILSREYEWARRILAYSRGKYNAWNSWVSRQNIFIQSSTFIATTLVVLTTLWLVNVFGMFANLFDIKSDILISPLFK